MSTIVVLTAFIEDGADDIADDIKEVLQVAADSNWQGPGRLVTIRQHDLQGSHARADVIKAAAWDAVVGTLTLVQAAARDA